MNDDLTLEILRSDILQVSDNLVIPRLPRTIRSIFSLFLIVCYYVTRFSSREIRPKNVGKLYCIRNRAMANAYLFLSLPEEAQ